MDNSLTKINKTDYNSEFEYSNDGGSECSSYEVDEKRIDERSTEIYKKPKKLNCALTTQLKKEQYEKDYIKHQSMSLRAHLLTMDPCARHKKLVNDYLVLHGGTSTDSKPEEIKNSENSEMREHERFVWHEGDEYDSWGSRLAKNYWDRLFKEYCLIDLTRYKLNKFGMRWRLEKEVVAGKGQFICGDYNCEERRDLRSWEVKFNYIENNEKRTVLVKVRLCSDCSDKLNHHHRRREVTKFPPKRKLISPYPLDDEVLDKDAFSGYNIDDIKNTLKRARRESNRSLTEDEDNNSSGTESQINQDNIVYGSTAHGDSSHNSVTSSGASSPLSVSSLSEDESSATGRSHKKKTVFREHGFDKYINDLLL